MTTFCLVHGAWHDETCWAPLVAVLQARGHDCITPVLPLEDADASFEHYAKVVIDAVRGCGAPVHPGLLADVLERVSNAGSTGNAMAAPAN